MLPADADAVDPAKIGQQGPGRWTVTGHWTVRGLGLVQDELKSQVCERGAIELNGAAITGLDSAGAWVLQQWLSDHGAKAALLQWQPRWQALMDSMATRTQIPLVARKQHSRTERVGRRTVAAARELYALLHFVGECTVATISLVAHPSRIRWRTGLLNIQISGFQALPIIGLTSFLLGVVIAYQGADQLKNYGANIFVVDLIGYAMLREFAPLITAIIIAGRSASAYAAQIGTMVVTEEVDAMRTLGIDPLGLLVLPKLFALAIALPLLTVFADITGVFGGMLMARSQLGIGMVEFIDRFGREIHGASLLIGVGKSIVFAAIITTIGCFQGFQTRGSADSVGRQTTLSVVQSIFLVIVVDALFSIAFSVLGI